MSVGIDIQQRVLVEFTGLGYFGRPEFDVERVGIMKVRDWNYGQAERVHAEVPVGGTDCAHLLARSTVLGRESLYKALSSDGNPSFRTVLGVATALGYRFTVRAVS